MLSIISYDTLIENILENLFNIMWIFVSDDCYVCCYSPLRVNVASSVNSIKGSIRQLVCNQWQNSRCVALSPLWRFCTCCRWNAYKLSSYSIRHICVCCTETCSNSSRANTRITLYLNNVFLFVHISLTSSFRHNTNTGKRTTFM